MTYAIETRAENATTKRLLQTTEMRTLRGITGCSLRDHIRNNDIRTQYGILDVVRWGRIRKREWRDHVDRKSRHRKGPPEDLQYDGLRTGVRRLKYGCNR